MNILSWIKDYLLPSLTGRGWGRVSLGWVFLWAHRRQNGFIFAEIALIAVLSFYLIDSITVWAYGTYFCRADGEFEKEHLLIAQTGQIADINTDIDVDSVGQADGQALLAPLFAFRDEIARLPEVQSVCLTQNIVGDGYGHWYYRAMAPEADTTRTCSSYFTLFCLNQRYFETLGLTAAEGSPSVEQLSSETPADGVVITRSLARALFGTDEAVGRRVVQIEYKPGPDARDVEHVSHHTVTGIVEDVKPNSHERHHYLAFLPYTTFGMNTPKMLIRLKPDASAEAFVAKHGNFANGIYAFASLSTYKDYQQRNSRISDQYVIVTLLSTLGLLFALNVVFGTLGTFWLQIRKRTEDIGIMRSFGAKRSHIFWMIWGEGAVLTLLACIVGQIVWFQFAINIGLADGGIRATSLRETDWVDTFALHFLIVSAVQYVLLLAIVTLGILVPTFIAMYKRPVEALRHE